MRLARDVRAAHVPDRQLVLEAKPIRRKEVEGEHGAYRQTPASDGHNETVVSPGEPLIPGSIGMTRCEVFDELGVGHGPEPEWPPPSPPADDPDNQTRCEPRDHGRKEQRVFLEQITLKSPFPHRAIR